MKVTTATYAEVAPKTPNKPANPGARKAAFEAVKAQIETLVPTDVNDPNRPALLIELEPTDKYSTAKAQILRSATQLGIEVYIRRSKDTVRVFKTGDLTPEVTEAANTQKKRGPKPRKEKEVASAS